MAAAGRGWRRVLEPRDAAARGHGSDAGETVVGSNMTANVGAKPHIAAQKEQP